MGVEGPIPEDSLLCLCGHLGSPYFCPLCPTACHACGFECCFEVAGAAHLHGYAQVVVVSDATQHMDSQWPESHPQFCEWEL